MKLLATDLDRTLLPNGHWEADAQAIPLFNILTARHGLIVAYVTGRNLDLVERAIAEYGIRHPDILIGDVGTTIRRRTDGQWHFDPGWIAHVRANSPRWDPAAVRAALAGIAGMRLQEPEHLNDFKQSWYTDHARREAILAEVHARIDARFDARAIYSFDSQDDTGLLDLLPASANKRTALEYAAEALGASRDRVVFCGDSGNDIAPLTAGFCGVLVRNADAQLVADVEAALARDPSLRVYFARGGFMGLSGYYTSGVLEGAAHYGLLPECGSVET